MAPATPCRWDLNCEAFGEDDTGRTFTVAGVLFVFVKGNPPVHPGFVPIDAWSMARTEAITIAINDATDSTITVKNDDGTVHIYGPVGLVCSSDSPGVVATLIDAGSAEVCE